MYQCAINNPFILCCKPRKNLKFGVEVILRSMQQQQQQQICIYCATLFTGILQTMNYHFKAGQVRAISCPEIKQKKQREHFVWRFISFYICRNVICVVAKPAALNQPRPLAELWLTLQEKLPHANGVSQQLVWICYLIEK